MSKEKSSGTEKAESLTRKKSGGTKSKRTSAEKGAKKPVKSVKNKEKGVDEKKRLKAEARDKKRIEAAKIKAEKKQRRLEKKLEHKQKRLERLAAIKEKRAERREKRRERRDMLKSESKKERLERRAKEKQARLDARIARREAAAAERQARREHRLKMRAEKRANRKEHKHAPGFAGWLAAVIALGVTTLALGSTLTVGWLKMDGMEADMAATHTQSLYELNSIVDNLDANLSKARVSSSAADQSRILSDIAIQSEMAEVILERLPVDGNMTESMTSFVNKMGDSAQSMLYAVARGDKLTRSQKATLEYMYEMNSEFKRALNELTSTANPKDMLAAMKNKSGNFLSTSFSELENVTIETPKEIQDGPFSDSVKKVNAKGLEGLKEISATRAEELAKKYFADYDVQDVTCTGETNANSLNCYNLSITTPDGEMSAQLSKLGGKVVMFNSFKDCSTKNFDVERCTAIAEDFLEDLGLSDMKAVWTSENGTVCNLNFAYEHDGVIFYPDMIKVKVCEERGKVIGMEGVSYVLNHTERKSQKATVSLNNAKSKLNSEFKIEGSRLAVIPLDEKETLTYEFYGSYGNNDYYVYIDAKTGDEVEVLTAIGTAQGRALM